MHHLDPMTSSYAHGPTDVPLLDMTIGKCLRSSAERHGDRDALVVRDQGYRATYTQLWQQVDRAARALLARGVRKGDRVGIWAPNRFRVGPDAVRDRSCRRDPRHDQPR